MPRICKGNNDPIDFCKHCFPKEENAIRNWGDGEGPDGRGNCFEYNAYHPDYEGTGYRCYNCKRYLGLEDE